ncbi:16S rRNA (uracil(1498)-N(3))-methyltransferase [Schaalia sp. lx-100]|uniref:16S rRNA (uracil(1498)-N(3))-methyltransferase n=1 Tax=Schaalia sp. lx-100 TaxID=2899081 RepID=UPI001E567945|nr:16S rRNA (uracil(1498)-N(3))-methyltransferase [Schaalia sp. lx-100]MCD4558020.1 16S rRNA (uracil(1498)-N(3))-methyltransferase [Schaalia sp. lx-100]
MTRQVFFADDLHPHAQEPRAGDRAILTGDEAHHASVKRIENGELIDLVDGYGKRLICEVHSVTKKALEVTVRDVIDEEAAMPRLTLVQALAKGGRDEQAVETATEVGVDCILPWQANRSIVRWTRPKSTKGQAKWCSVARTAAKQSRRAWVPSVTHVYDSRALVEWVRLLAERGGVVLLCHEEASDTAVALLNDKGKEWASCPEIAVIVGPEGGIDSDEVASLCAAGAFPVLLGPHVLRASTAGPVALALVSAAIGRWS